MLLTTFIYLYLYPLIFGIAATFLYEFYTKIILGVDLNNEIDIDTQGENVYDILLFGCFIPILNILSCFNYIRTIIIILQK